MSRIIIKGLPPYLTEQRLRDHFAARGSVTDVKLMRRPDGTSRCFGFIGFKDDESALDAQKYFDRTYVDTMRIQVELARKIGDESLPDRKGKRAAPTGGEPPSKKVALSSSGVISNSSASVSAKPLKKDGSARNKKGVSFEEFMAVMAPKSKRKTWQNEEGGEQAALTNEDFSPDKLTRAEVKEGKRKRKLERHEKRTAAAEAAAATAAANAPPVDEASQSTPADAAVNDEGMTDLDYMHRRMKRKIGGDEEAKEAEAKAAAEKAFEQSDSEADDDVDAESSDSEIDDEEAAATREKERQRLEAAARQEQEIIDTIMKSGRLFVRNLPFAASEDELEAHFAQWGQVEQAHIALDKTTKASKGLAFVRYANPAHALAAFRAADGTVFQGRLLHVMPAVDSRPTPTDATATAKTLKAKKHDERKADAGKEFNWGMLYMSADAVASSVADRLGVEKSQILNADEEGGLSPAVKLALAETRIIQETKAFLIKEGIDIDAFQQAGNARKAAARSETCILVKNFPYGTSTDALKELFAAHGDVLRVVMPPAGTMAIVEMAVPGEARVAFKALAYKRMGNSVIYLEKAPAEIFKAREDAEAASAAAVPKGAPVPPSKTARMLGAGAGNEADVQPGATLFVKNLAFTTTDEALARAFSHLADFAFARVQTRPDARSPGARQSMGYGFVGFRSVASATTAREAMDGKSVDGHAISLAFAKRGQDEDAAGASSSKAGSAPSTKLVVKNLPFEATKKDVRALFAAHGELKSVRVPRKGAAAGGATAGARGFAFVEFTSRREAEVAMEALRHTHLLGRHLVLKWDTEDARGVEAAREKTLRALPASGETTAKKAKVRLANEDILDAVAKERKARDDVDSEPDEA